MQLKAYQQRVLDSLQSFLAQCGKGVSPHEAFRAILSASGRSDPYLAVGIEGLSGIPYVCIRVPTGGGKTLLGAYTVGLALTEYLRADRTVALWLVPSTTILEQTAKALRDPNHPYRRGLELRCGNVEVLTIEEALQLSRATVDGATVVIVSTIQAFRVEDPTGRKVYEQNGALAEHFLNLPAQRLADLQKGPDDNPKPSLVNVLRLRRPIVIVDEAHNARTELSFATLATILPSSIIEFTATPSRQKTPSNVLHRVSAAELKAEQMIKLPLRVIHRHPSQRDDLLRDAVTFRKELEKIAGAEAQATGEYLRPILLIQAERVDATEPLRERLFTEMGIPKEQVKISTGKKDELASIADISAPNCPVRYIITVEKLREGWDCPFAYVLCSLKETRSETAIEQIVGRILRLPHATAKKYSELNCAYAFSVSDSIVDTLQELRGALENNGFTPPEAAGAITIETSGGTIPLGVQPQIVALEPGKEIDIVQAQDAASALGGKVQVDPSSGAVTITTVLTTQEAAVVATALKTPEAKAKFGAVVVSMQQNAVLFGASGSTQPLTAAQRGLPFLVPRLAIQEKGHLFEFDDTVLLEHPWKLSDKDASLSSLYNPLQRPEADIGQVDVTAKGSVETQVLKEKGEADFIGRVHQHVLQLGMKGEWTESQLIAWLDGQTHVQDIPAFESAAFMLKVVTGLKAKFNITDVNILARDRFRLRDEVRERIEHYRSEERQNAFQHVLKLDSLTVSDSYAIDFSKVDYAPSVPYNGGHRFANHYFPPGPGDLRITTSENEPSEEFYCADYIDRLPEVEYWIRNIPRRPTSFRLQTSSDYFYPDFLCKLRDGRILAVEYKGSQFIGGPDANEKEAIGNVWASRSNGRCLFVMPTGKDFGVIAAKVRGS